MTAIDHWQATGRDQRSARPWAFLALAVFGAGILTVLVRGATLESTGTGAAVGWVAILVAGALAGLFAAAQRDIISWGTLTDALLVTGAVGLFSWMYPRFGPDVVGWDEDARLRLTAIGLGLGALLSVIIVLGLVRRPPTPVAGFFLAALAFLLAARIAATTRELVSAGFVFAAFGALAGSWVYRPRLEPEWHPPPQRVRMARLALQLTALVIAAIALRTALTRDEPDQPAVAIGLCILVMTIAAFSAYTLRRDRPYEQEALGYWQPWRAAQHAAEFDAALFDYAPAAERARSEWNTDGTLRLADDSFWTALGIGAQTDFEIGSIAHPEDKPQLATVLTAGLMHRQPFDHAFRIIDPTSGRRRIVRLVGEPSETGTVLIGASVVEIQPRSVTAPDAAGDLRSEESASMAMTNPITGLRTTEFVDFWLDHYATENRRHTDNASLVIVEVVSLDVFDRMAPLLRDLMMTELGHRLTQVCRSGDFLAHLDGPYFLMGARLAVAQDRTGLLERVEDLLIAPTTTTTPEVHPRHRMVTLKVEPGVDITRVLGVAAAAFTSDHVPPNH